MTPQYLALFGLAVAVWLGGANVLFRRLVQREDGDLGGRHAIWFRNGFFYAPDWLSFTMIGIGVAIMAVAGVWAMLSG